MENPLKQLESLSSKKILCGVVTLLFLLLMFFVHRFFSPKTPYIYINSDREFSGTSFEFKGSVDADCHCSLALSLNGEEMVLDKQGNFSKTITIENGADEWKYELVATAHGNFINTFTERKEREGSIIREEAKVEISPKISEWGQDSIEFLFEGQKDTRIKIAVFSSYFVYKPDDKSRIQLFNDTLEIDDSGAGKITLPFENSENNRETVYEVKILLDGYSTNEEKFKLKNTNFNEEKMKEEGAAYEEEKEMNSIIESMDSYSGNDTTKIAVDKGVKTGRTLGSYYVLDPNNFHLVSPAVYIKNTGFVSSYVNPNYVTILDENGRTYSHDTATYYYTNYLDSIELQPNTYTSGYLAFVLPKAQHKFTLIYNDGSGAIRKEIYVK